MKLFCLVRYNFTVRGHAPNGPENPHWLKRCGLVLILQTCLFVLTSGVLVVAQESGDALFINDQGQVGIGKNDPRASLDVAGTILGVGMLPPGGIAMYYGAIEGNFDKDGKGVKDTDYEGWQLCNGNNESPDLLDKFITMAGKEYKMGDQGGSDSVTLTVDHMPAHNHAGFTGDAQTSKPKVITNVAKKAGLVTATTHASGPNMEDAPVHTHSIPSEGSGKAHENRPQFYALAFIMRLPASTGK